MAASNEHVEKVTTVRKPSADSIRYTQRVTWMEKMPAEEEECVSANIPRHCEKLRVLG